MKNFIYISSDSESYPDEDVDDLKSNTNRSSGLAKLNFTSEKHDEFSLNNGKLSTGMLVF